MLARARLRVDGAQVRARFEAVLQAADGPGETAAAVGEADAQPRQFLQQAGEEHGCDGHAGLGGHADQPRHPVLGVARVRLGTAEELPDAVQRHVALPVARLGVEPGGDQPGGHILLTLLWQSLQSVEKDYQVFVHLLNDRGEKVLQRDGQPVLWMRPTSTWRPGDEILDRYGLLLPPTLATGRYTLAVGLYDAVTGQRLAVSAGPTDFAIELGPIEVE